MPVQSWANRSDVQRPARPVAAPPAPRPFFDAVGRGFTTGAEDQWRNRTSGWREAEWREDLFRRHWEIERITGRKLPISAEMAGNEVGPEGEGWVADASRFVDNALSAPARALFRDPSAEAYEAQIDALRGQFPDLEAVPNRAALYARRDAELREVRRRAQEAGADGAGGMIGGFVGGLGASLGDPVNIAATLATGGAGAGRPLLTRMAAQAVANAGVEAVQVPGRMIDAEILPGPEYDMGDAAADVTFGALFGAGFEPAGDVLKIGTRPLRRAMGWHDDPATRGLGDALDRLFDDEATIGVADDFDGARAALDRGEPMPAVEPERDLSELFANQSPGEVSGGIRQLQREPAEASSPGGQPEMTGGLQSTTYYGREIHAGRFDPLSVEVDAARFQYKADGDAEGVTGRLRGVERWDATASGKAILFEDTDGRQFVADGHQRRGLARRLAEQGWEDALLDGYLFRARDGWSAREVRVVAALKNIREGSGSTLDAAKLFREAPAALNDRSLPISGDLIRQARQLAGLSDDAFRAVVNKVIPEGFGAVIGEQAAGRPEIHADLVELLRRGEPRGAEGARALVQEGLLDDFLASEGRQMDLFGGLPRESTVIARGRIREAVLSALRRDEKLNAALVRNAEAIEAGGNILARSENEARLAVDRAASELVSRLALRSGEMGEAFQLAATAVTRGEATPAAAAKGLIARIRAAVAAGERLDEIRAEVLTPDPPGPAALKAVEAFDQPGGPGQKGQLAEKPEDVGTDSAGLFDDLPETVSEDRALSVLKACAPGAPV